MLFDSKEKQDMYIAQTISNLAADEATFNMSNRNNFRDNQDVWGVQSEEVMGVAESYRTLERLHNEFLLSVMKNDPERAKLTREKIKKEAVHLAHEAIQVAGIQIKAQRQLEGETNAK